MQQTNVSLHPSITRVTTSFRKLDDLTLPVGPFSLQYSQAYKVSSRRWDASSEDLELGLQRFIKLSAQSSKGSWFPICATLRATLSNPKEKEKLSQLSSVSPYPGVDSSIYFLPRDPTRVKVKINKFRYREREAGRHNTLFLDRRTYRAPPLAPTARTDSYQCTTNILSLGRWTGHLMRGYEMGKYASAGGFISGALIEGAVKVKLDLVLEFTAVAPDQAVHTAQPEPAKKLNIELHP